MKRKIHPLRSCFTLVGLGLFLSACGLTDRTIGKVGQEAVKASELKAHIDAIRDPAVRQDPMTKSRVLDAIIRDKLIAGMAEKAGMEKSIYFKQLLATELAVTDKEVAKYHQAHPKEWAGLPNSHAYIRAVLQRQKFEAWLQHAKTVIPVTVDQSAVNSVVLSK